MSEIISAVYDFNELIVRVEDRPLNQLTEEQAMWLFKALREEATEFIDGDILPSVPEQIVARVDALIDSVYFAVGGLKKMGLTRELALECFRAVHEANMTKRRGAKAKRGNFAEDAVKPDGWQSPEERIRKILFGG